MTDISLHCYVSGRVQGVFFRDGTRQICNEKGVTGWAKNIPDGRVEIMLSGEKSKVEEVRNWLWQGPRAAKVENVEVKEIPFESFSEFEIRH